MTKNCKLLVTVMLYILFSLYILLLLGVLFLARIGSGGAGLEYSVNIIPFHSISAYKSQIGTSFRGFAIMNVFGNILMFVPMGLYLPVLRGGKKLLTHLGCVFLFSLSAEIIQSVLRVGALDVDDIILNCMGGILGLAVYKILRLILKKEYPVRIFTVIGSMAAGVLFAVYIFYQQ